MAAHGETAETPCTSRSPCSWHLGQVLPLDATKLLGVHFSQLLSEEVTNRPSGQVAITDGSNFNFQKKCAGFQLMDLIQRRSLPCLRAPLVRRCIGRHRRLLNTIPLESSLWLKSRAKSPLQGLSDGVQAHSRTEDGAHAGAVQTGQRGARSCRGSGTSVAYLRLRLCGRSSKTSCPEFPALEQMPGARFDSNSQSLILIAPPDLNSSWRSDQTVNPTSSSAAYQVRHPLVKTDRRQKLKTGYSRQAVTRLEQFGCGGAQPALLAVVAGGRVRRGPRNERDCLT